MTPDFVEKARQLFSYTRDLRRDLHRHPELAFQEIRTAGVIARELSALGLEVNTGIAETGVVGLLRGGRPGPVVLLRVDMDALPIQEENDAPYRSQIPGVMHACGHDGHVAIGLTVGSMLQRHAKELAGCVKFVFQPAEETGQGAQRMIDEGVLKDPEPDYSLSVHLWNSKPVGWIGLTPGAAMAASDRFQIQIEGIGGHAARPNVTTDPILAATLVVQSLQSIVARSIFALDSAVLSVTSFQGGNSFNVIPSRVDLKGTIRTFQDEVRSLVLERMDRIVQGTSETMGCTAGIDLISGPPPLVNDPSLTQRVQETISEILPEVVLSQDERVMGSDDMAYIMQKVPGCYMFIGSANEEQGLAGRHHHPRFDFDEQALPMAAAVTGSVIHRLLTDI
jgi:amidohydrolase